MSLSKFDLKIILVLVFLVFIFSANLAWLNPDVRGAIKTLDYPLFWQYDVDAILELGTAVYFPEIFDNLPTRVTRPLYPFIVNSLGKFFTILLPIKLNFIYLAAFSYFLMKIVIYLLSGFCLLKICKYFKLDKNTCLIASILFFLNPFLVKGITTFHTIELQILLPVISTYFFILFMNKKLNIFFFSILLGLLFLAKNNYAIVLTIYLFLILKKKFKLSLFFLFFFSLPTLVWTFFYNSYLEINYSPIQESKNYGWLQIEGNLLFYLKGLFTAILTFLKSYYFFFTLLIFTHLKKIFILKKNDIFSFILIFCFSIIIQMFASNYLDSEYMTKDIHFIVSIFSALFIVKVLNKYNLVFKNYILIISMIILANTIFKLGNFTPWVHPDNQSILVNYEDFMYKSKKIYGR